MARATETSRTRRIVLRGLVGRITIMLVVFTVAVYAGIYARTRDLALHEVEEQARTYVELIVATRAWNSSYGGVYVERGPGVESNPYLEELGVEADIECTDGTALTLRNPALMTNEIANRLERETGVRFHLTSLDPVNPDNAADPWERKGLESFEAGGREVGELISGGRAVYRYMVPLVVEGSCMECHAAQGYQIGEIRGGISVDIPVDSLQSELRVNAVGLLALASLTLLGILGVLYIMSIRVVDRVEEAERQLEHLAVTDSLTDLWNRRYMMRRLKAEFDRSRRQGHDLGLIMLDLDHFKEVNDQLGHAYGDLVLQTAAHRMHGAIRDYDVLGRFGGEEFLVIAAETDTQGVLALAERIRSAISAGPISGDDREVMVTSSAGVAMLDESDHSPDTLLARADGALYAAKRTGRDRVVLGETAESRGLV